MSTAITDRFPKIDWEKESKRELEWEAILERLSQLCSTELGVKRALELEFFNSKAEAERELNQLDELLKLYSERGEELPLGSVADLRKVFSRLEKGGTLDPHDFLSISELLETTYRVLSFLKQYREQMPSVWERGELLEPLRELRLQIDRTIDRSGKIRDDASWELASLREEARRLHEKIRKKIQEYLSPPYSEHLTDLYYTIRQDRYVLPVRASARSKIPGIVYGMSSSGATVFIEPQPLIEMNNALRVAEEEVAREEERILKELSRKTLSHLYSLQSNFDLITDLDILKAKVALAAELEGSIPQLVEPDEPGYRIQLKKARHPLLILQGVNVVANDIELGPEGRILIISGPNTGGKTVTLKTVGMCALMARAGMAIPADEKSCIPFFKRVFTDIGDHQDIQLSLSTFSAQIIKVREILEKADDQSLVLIDEVIVATSPEQGAALATATLEKLAETGCFAVVTTHYDQLKALAYENPVFVNASVGFDVQTLSPTYRLFIGTPGSSSAMEIARQLGLDEELCKRAEALLSPEADRFDRIIRRLEQQYEELYLERERATKARSKLERELQIQEEKTEKLERLRQSILSREGENWQRELNEAKELLRELKRELKRTKNPDASQLQKFEKKLERAVKKAQSAQEKVPKPKPPRPPDPEQLRPGAKVQIRSLNVEGEIVGEPDKDGEYLIQAGIMKLRRPLQDLKLLAPPQKKRISRPKKKEKTTTHGEIYQFESTDTFGEETPQKRRPPVIKTAQNSCDVRGKTIEEAIEEVERFLDRALRLEIPAVIVIHGHGTGKLRQAVRDYFRQSPYVEDFRPGLESEGGNGVTVAFLRM